MTTATTPGDGSAPLMGARALENEQMLDGVGATIGKVAGMVLPRGEALRMLRGKGFGHALHPVLTDLPLGCWTAVAVLDLTGPDRYAEASRRLIGTGLLFGVPTAYTGLAEWTRTSGGSRRVATAHAVLNFTVTLSYLTSWMLRRRDHTMLGMWASFVGGSVAIVSSYLGGHLTLVLKEPVEGPVEGE